MDANDNEHKYGDGRFSTGPEAPPRLPPRPHRTHRPILNNNTIHGVAPPVPPLPVAPVALAPAPPPAREPQAPAGLTLERNGQTLRRQNLYVDTPRRLCETPAVHKTTATHITKQVSAILNRDNTTVTTNLHTPANAITRQPQSEPLKHDSLSQDEHQDSVICLKCRKCKCSSCTDPRPLPSRWVCGHNLSAETVVETCTCYCCVKGIFYHMFKDKEMDDDHMSENDPCACCDQRHCCQRWCCIGAMTVCLPCLCCFPPLKGLVNVITACYNHCNRRGCTCPRQRRPSQTKRFLLDSSDGSSS